MPARTPVTPTAPAQTPAPVSTVPHNIHSVRTLEEARCCLDGQCNRCIDFQVLSVRARSLFDCVLVRRGEGVFVDNDDNDPTQPTYRQDNAAFDMICKLEEEKEELERVIEGLKKHERENVELKKEVEASKKLKKEMSTVKGQLTVSRKTAEDRRKHADGLDAKIALLQKDVADGPENVFAVCYQIRPDINSEQSVKSAELKGVFLKVEQANTALLHFSSLVFSDWQSVQKKVLEVSDGDPTYASPGPGEAAKWKTSAGEMRVAVNLRDAGTGFLWVARQKMQGALELEKLRAEAKRARKLARKEAKMKAKAGASIQPPATPVGTQAFAEQTGTSSPLEEEPFECENFDTVSALGADLTHPPPPAPMQRPVHEDTAILDQSEVARSIELGPHLITEPAASANSQKPGLRRPWNVVSLSREASRSIDHISPVRKHESTPRGGGPGAGTKDQPPLCATPTKVDWEARTAYVALGSQTRIKEEDVTPVTARVRRFLGVGA